MRRQMVLVVAVIILASALTGCPWPDGPPGPPGPTITGEQESWAYTVFLQLGTSSLNPNGSTIVDNGDGSCTFSSYEYDPGATADGTFSDGASKVSADLSLDGDPQELTSIAVNFTYGGPAFVGNFTINGVTLSAQRFYDWLGGPRWSPEGTAADPVDITGLLPYSGQVDTSLSFYVASGFAPSQLCTVTMTGLSDDIDLYVFGDENLTIFLGGSWASGTTDESVTVAPSGFSLYIVADGYYSAAGSSFTLDVQF